MKVIVTGATGVLGQEATAALVEAGHEVTGVTRRESGVPIVSGRGGTPAVADVFDHTAMVSLFRGHDAVVNTLTNMPVGTATIKPGAWRDDDRLHAEASAVIANAAIEAGINRLIQESTTFLYPDCGENWITEDTPLAPKLPYQKPRVMALRNAVDFARQGRVSVVLRFGLLYGRDRQSTYMLANARAGKPALLGAKHQYTSLIHNTDAGTAFVAALRASTGVYNIAGEPILRERFAKDLAREAGAPVEAKFYPEVVQIMGGGRIEPMRRSHRISSKRFQAETGWQPQIGPSTPGWSR